jgi:hypothetical protein
MYSLMLNFIKHERDNTQYESSRKESTQLSWNQSNNNNKQRKEHLLKGLTFQ